MHTHAHTHTHIHTHTHTHTHTLTHIHTHTFSDIVDFLCIKNNLFLNNDLDNYHITATRSGITATRSGSPVPVNLDSPSTDYAACVVEIRPTNQEAESKDKEKVCLD